MNDARFGSRAVAHLLMLLWVLLVGGSFPLAAGFNDALSPYWLTAIRFAMAAALMLPWVICRGQWLPRTLRAWAGYTLMGALLAIFFGSQFIALNLTSALSVAALFVTLPTLAWLLASLLGLERSGIGRLLVLLTGAVGALGLTLRGHSSGITFGMGEWVFLLGCASMAGYSVSSRFLVARNWLPDNPLLATFWSLLIGALLVLLPVLFLESGEPGETALFWHLLGFDDVVRLLLLALLASCLSFWILQSTLQVLMPSSVAAYSYLTPLIALLLELQADTTQLDLARGVSLLLLLLTVVWLIRSDNAPLASKGA